MRWFAEHRQSRHEPAMGQVIEVAACVVRDSSGRVLMARRRVEQMSPGCWEIPGGKIEPGETAETAAVRELFEETGLRVASLKPFATYFHDFATRRVALRFFEATHWTGMPVGRENQLVEWVDPKTPQIAPILPSNGKVLDMLNMPALVRLAKAPCCNPADWASATVQHALKVGAGAVFLADKNLVPGQRANLSRRLGTECARHGLPVWLQDGNCTSASGNDAFTLYSNRATLPVARNSGAIIGLVNADAAQLALATDEADFFVVPMPKNAEDCTTGWTDFAHLTQVTSAPVYAIIENDAATIKAAFAAGATGVCVA